MTGPWLASAMARPSGGPEMSIAAAATPSVYIARRWIDGKTFTSLGLRLEKRSVIDTVFGFALSGLMAGLIFGAMWALGYIDNIRISAMNGSTIGLLLGPLLVERAWMLPLVELV